MSDRSLRKRPGRAAPLTAAALGAGDGLLLIGFATAAMLRSGADNLAPSAIALLSGLVLLWGAVAMTRRIPIGRVLLSVAAVVVAVGLVVLLVLKPPMSGLLVDVVTGAVLVGLQTVIVACALSRSTLLWIVGAPDSRRRR
ncbi:MAG TPA: hypothetical protein VGN22_15620 [Pseudonocardia sp.]